MKVYHSVHKVSVIIPVYVTTADGLVWLRECLESVRKQTYPVEISAVDDGSTMDVASVFADYGLSYYKQSNQGVSVARNVATEMATSELILPLDCDDRLKINAVAKLVDAWKGIPIYPDIEKFGELNVPHYVLLDFDCDYVYRYVGYTSVNVLHAKSQWQQIGGWDPKITFYEDGEYNARLLGTFCGEHLKEPLVEYRIHSGQRTKTTTDQKLYAKKVLMQVRSYDMPCPGCGKKRSISNASKTNKSVAVPSNVTGSRSEATMFVSDASVPLEFEGKVLATYVGGKGKGAHYYKGLVSREVRRVKFGDTVYVDPRDARDAEDVASTKLYVRMKLDPAIAQAKKVAPAQAEKASPAVVKRAPRAHEDVAKTPVTEPKVVEVPDIYNMTLKEIGAMDIDAATATELLAAEKNGRNRTKVIAILQGKMGKKEYD